MTRDTWCRLLLNALLGVACLTWIHAYTDYGAIVLTALAFGGILSWLGVMGKVFTSEQHDEIRRWVAALLFESRAAWVLTVVLAVCFVSTLFLGVVEVSNMQGGDALVRTYPKGNEEPAATDDDRVPVGGESRYTRIIWPWSSTGQTVRISGLPRQSFTVRPWWRECGPLRVTAPGSFLRPVILLPAPSLLNGYEKEKGFNFTVIVKLNDKEVVNKAYDRKAIVFGTADATFASELRSTSDPLRDLLTRSYSASDVRKMFLANHETGELKYDDKVEAEIRSGAVVFSILTIRIRSIEIRTNNVHIGVFGEANP